MEELTLEELQKLMEAIDEAPIEITIKEEEPSQALFDSFPIDDFQEEEAAPDALVQLDVVLGRAKVPVSELLTLKAGQLFPLDTLIDQPVAIEIDGETIAYGEIVEEEGRYGILVTEKP